METNITIDELDLSVRSFNCLKRAGINTFADLCTLLDEGVDLRRIRNMGLKSTREVLQKAKLKGYPSDEAVATFIETLKSNPEVAPESIHSWEEIHKSLLLVEPKVQQTHFGTTIASLVDISSFVAKRLEANGIGTVEELLTQYKSEEMLPVADHVKWRLLRTLDKNGYRFSECSKEDWPDIDEYILQKRASRYAIEALELPDGVEDILKTAGITVTRLVNEKWTFLQDYLGNLEIALLLHSLDNLGLRTKDTRKCECPDITSYIVDNIQIPTSTLGLSPRIYNSLHERSIDTLSKLLDLNRQQLIENKVVGVTAMKELTRVLQDNHFHLKGDTFYQCARCGTQVVAAENHEDEHYCYDCADRIKRINRIKDYVVTVDGPDYGSYTDGTKGFTIFATVHNKSKKMVEIKLREFMLYCDDRQWASTSNLTGYSFVSEHIMPESSKTSAKIWSGFVWRDKRLSSGDYITFSISVKDKVYSYKFVMKNGKFEIDDYFTY